jgi:hypothetical protein
LSQVGEAHAVKLCHVSFPFVGFPASLLARNRLCLFFFSGKNVSFALRFTFRKEGLLMWQPYSML